MFEIIPNWHPIFVHFTVALFSMAVGLFVITPFVKSPLKEQWQTVAYWLLWFGAGFTVITAATGLYAYNTVAHDTPSHAAMTEHRNWAIATITLFTTLAVWSIVSIRRNKAQGVVFSAAMILAGGILAATAWHGGEVVFRYGLGVISLPKADEHHHHHDGGVTHSGMLDAHEADEDHHTADHNHSHSADEASENEDHHHHDDDHDHDHDH